MSRPLRVLVADDHRDARMLIVRMLTQAAGSFEVVATVGSADAAIAAADRDSVDVAVLDYDMPGGGPMAAEVISEQHPHVRIVAVSGYDDGEAERIMRAAGASTFFSKRMMLDELVGFFETVHAELA